ncbi:5433_t:CDS:2 [Cetraspora pellucida]|uniref:5433_t:CDS:1 n=1 Tax=Cetraspora pellucida TaxID=1433469 RepID=A0ACA9N538_9GLOM|nr:5433_t:CDS:2 [Cetraspora pellucida]
MSGQESDKIEETKEMKVAKPTIEMEETKRTKEAKKMNQKIKFSIFKLNEEYKMFMKNVKNRVGILVTISTAYFNYTSEKYLEGASETKIEDKTFKLMHLHIEEELIGISSATYINEGRIKWVRYYSFRMVRLKLYPAEILNIELILNGIEPIDYETYEKIKYDEYLVFERFLNEISENEISENENHA